MASKLVLVLGLCVFAILLLFPVTATEVDHAVGSKKAAQTTKPTDSGPVVPPRNDHYVTGCKRCCYLDERGCIACCGKGQL